MIEHQNETINKPVSELPLSQELKAILKDKGYQQLKDVLAKPVSFLRGKEGLSFEQELELYKIVEANGLEKYWQD
jgi:hypothetical protein